MIKSRKSDKIRQIARPTHISLALFLSFNLIESEAMQWKEREGDNMIKSSPLPPPPHQLCD